MKILIQGKEVADYQLKLKKSPQALEAEILGADLCCSCGGCLGLCPYFKIRHEKVALLEPCGLNEGRCYDICPRTETDFAELNRQVFGQERRDYVLGTLRAVLMSQSRDSSVKKAAQYGGTVSALLIQAFEDKAIAGAILARTSERYPLLPEPFLARNAGDVLLARGSKYTACPSLAILDESLRQCEKLAVVARPCQVLAIRKRQAIEPKLKDRIALVIGLFCMWALDYRDLVKHLKNHLDLHTARKFDIPYNRFVVYTKSGHCELDFEPIRRLRRHTCDICYDFTSELSDLSVGSTEWKDKWNTLIVRSDQGQAVLDAALSAGTLAVKNLPQDRVELLRTASLNKKKRVLAGLSHSGTYLKLDPQEFNWVTSQT